MAVNSMKRCWNSLLHFTPQRKFMTKRLFSAMIESHKATVNGVDLHYEIAGNSPEVVLCMPGALGSTRSDFGPQLTGLADKFTVVAFDPRGYGKSIPPLRDFPHDFYDRDADDAAELMIKIGFNKFSILGWSDGGISAMILAGEHPELVKKLVVWGSNSYVSEQDAEMISKVRDLSKWSAKMREPLEVMYGKDKLQDLWSSWVDAYLSFKDRHDDGDICKSSLPKIKVPVLIVHGDKDPIVPAFHPEYIHQGIKNSKLHHFPEGKHNLHLRYKDEFNALISNFLLNEEQN